MANVDSSIRIIPYYSHPHVHTVIRDNTKYDESVVTSKVDPGIMPYATVAVIGADTGVDNRFVRCNDLDVKKKIFGQANYDKYGQASLQAENYFNGRTDVWICRVLPDNAMYANEIVLAHFRKGKILDDNNQETGLHRMEIKFSVENVTKETTKTGAVSEDDIDGYARSFATGVSDPQTGYITVPIYSARIIGHGRYGNNFGLSIERDVDSEKEYEGKIYMFNLIDNTGASNIMNKFSGSLVQGISNSESTLIDDVLNNYSYGSCPISITSYAEYMEEIYNFYMEIVRNNANYLAKTGATYDQVTELKAAQSIELKGFDPIFGYRLNTRRDEIIPYYHNYTVDPEGGWVKPNLEVPNTAGATKPLNMKDWSTAFVGARVLVAADPLNGGRRWMYTVTRINGDTGNIVYDEGVETAIDADQYDGVNLSIEIGQPFIGGHDGDFQEITVNGKRRAPNSSEMKLLLSKEYVKAFRGLKDRRILSPARINLDFMFDANYNMTSDETIQIDDNAFPLYNSSTVLTDKDAAALSVLTSTGPISATYTDLNVKRAMYDLNNFRNKNGMLINPDLGAGCLAMFDGGLVGLKNIEVNKELANLINMFTEFTGRQCTVDFGYYDIVDPYTAKKEPVTVMYNISKNYVSHILREGLNKPYTNNYAQIVAIQRDYTLTGSGEMVRDSFKPDIDLIDWDVKEALYKSRINYWTTTEEGRVVQRSCQNTRITDASALLEESNVRVLNTLKKNLEKACSGYMYNWNDPTVRKGYTEAQKMIYKPWIGTIVEDLDIEFKADEWEQNRMIMHCYVSVKFRDIIKRIILEININRASYAAEG